MSTTPTVVMPPLHLLACAHCGTAAEAGLDPATLTCTACQAQYFALAQVPCLFPSGTHQRVVWQHQVAVMQAQGQQGLAQLQEAMSRYDLTDSTLERLIAVFEATRDGQQATLQLLEQAGLSPLYNEHMAQMDVGDLAEYYELILRDWAWGDEPCRHFDVSENTAALQRVLAVCRDGSLSADVMSGANVLVVGAGAGRLSWDLHVSLRPACTIALDSNPLLLSLANALVRQQQTLQLSGTALFPQSARPAAGSWTLRPPLDPQGLRDRWFALGADAWHMPFQRGSFDLIVTPWFMDVNGGDVRDLIGLFGQLLKPGGRWVNSGPLLFTRQLPFYQKYHHDEIREFLALAGFALEAERLDDTVHLASPLEARAQHEELWSFCAQAPRQTGQSGQLEGVQAPWLVMHHLAVPQTNFSPPEQHPLIDAILSLVDGQKSINDIAQIIAPHLPADITPKDAVVTLFGQMLEAQEDSGG